MKYVLVIQTYCYLTCKFKLDLWSRNAPIRVKIGEFLSFVTLKLDGWPWKTIGLYSYATSSFEHHFIAHVNSNWSYGPETAKLGFDLCDLEPWIQYQVILPELRTTAIWKIRHEIWLKTQITWIFCLHISIFTVLLSCWYDYAHITTE